MSVYRVCTQKSNREVAHRTSLVDDLSISHWSAGVLHDLECIGAARPQILKQVAACFKNAVGGGGPCCGYVPLILCSDSITYAPHSGQTLASSPTSE